LFPFSPATTQAETLGADWFVFSVAATAVGLVVIALILAPPLLWRRRSGALPVQNAGHRVVELGSTLTATAIVVGLFFFATLPHERAVDATVASPDEVVNVTAFRWSWRFAYPGTPVTIVGTPMTEPELVLPLGKTTEIDLRSADVQHSFWVPGFLFKRDAVPGILNRFDLTPTRVGDFEGVCAQFCGLDHTHMRFRVHVVPAEAFARWISSGNRKRFS